ncbi:hypothetical protein V8C42DRAFT_305564 [Trichoderma barbatum]
MPNEWLVPEVIPRQSFLPSRLVLGYSSSILVYLIMDLEWPCSADKLQWSSSYDISSPASLGIQKRSRDEMDSGGEAEPASKRRALSTRVDDVDFQDVDMSGTNICQSTPGNSCSSSPGKFYVLHSSESPPWWGSQGGNWSGLSWCSVFELSNEYSYKDTGGSYWYRVASSNQQAPCSSSTSNEKLIQDMSLLPNKTFFHINELMNARKRSRIGGDDVVELFARVVYTGCGHSFPSFQRFELEDLCGGRPPIRGVMMFKDEESPIYCESSPFLAAENTDDKCYCLCQVEEDRGSSLGWSLYIYDIQPVSWETIRSAHANMGKQG